MSVEQKAQQAVIHSEEWKNGITARLLRSYADSLHRRAELGETCIDSDLPYVLVRAASLLEKHCPEVIEHEKRRMSRI